MNKYENGVLSIYDNNDNLIELTDETILFYYERATPKKPFDYQNQGIDECKCGNRVYDTMNFCPNCGQALDWVNEDE